MEYFIARNMNNRLYLYDVEPKKCGRYFDTKACYAHEISCDLFPEITFENSPKKVKIEIL